MQRQQGFTLLELLVVMVLMAVLSAAAMSTLNFSAGDEVVETEARRIGALVSLAAEEALLTGREIGMELDQQQLRFWYFDDLQRRWLPLDQDGGPFRNRTLPGTIDADLTLEGRPVVLQNASGDEDEEKADDEEDTAKDSSGDVRTAEEQPEPQVLMFSSGQMTAFTLVLEDAELDAAWRIEADLLGRVTVEVVE